MNGCNIPDLYSYLGKVLTAAMRAHIANELKYKLGSIPSYKYSTPESRAQDWQRNANK